MNPVGSLHLYVVVLYLFYRIKSSQDLQAIEFQIQTGNCIFTEVVVHSCDILAFLLRVQPYNVLLEIEFEVSKGKYLRNAIYLTIVDLVQDILECLIVSCDQFIVLEASSDLLHEDISEQDRNIVLINALLGLLTEVSYVKTSLIA